MRLLFVYNADSGRLNTLLDIAHKAISPKTYQCSLCALTHDVFSERQTWKAFREASDHQLDFLHRDEFEAKHPPQESYPVILQVDDANENSPLFTSAQLDAFKSLDELIAALQEI